MVGSAEEVPFLQSLVVFVYPNYVREVVWVGVSPARWAVPVAVFHAIPRKVSQASLVTVCRRAAPCPVSQMGLERS